MVKFKSGIELKGEGDGVGAKFKAGVGAILKTVVGELEPPLDLDIEGLFCMVELRRCFCIWRDSKDVAGRENDSSTHLDRESLLSVSKT